MRGCSPRRCLFYLQVWGARSLRTSSRTRPQQPVVKQLTNSELLDLVKKSKKDSTTTPNTQNEAGDPEEQADDAQSQDLSSSPFCLPQSPLIDLRLVAARSRHRVEKPLPSKDKSLFQLKLQKNPYARALSTPPRICLVTSVRLPSYFQIPFGLATHPKTGAPWHLPKLSIDSSSSPNLEADQGIDVDDPQASPEPASSERRPSRVVSGTHILGSHHVIKYVSGMHKNTYRRIMPYRWKEDSSIKIPEIVWREDMDTFLLEILRKSVAKKLAYLASRRAAYIAICKGHENISKQNQVGAVLWLGPGGGAPAQDPPSNDDVEGSGPPPYAMHYYRSHYIPCYNLRTLLGPTHLQALRAGRLSHFGGQYAVIKTKRGTVDVQLELWKLLGYLAHDKKEGNVDRISENTINGEEDLRDGGIAKVAS